MPEAQKKRLLDGPGLDQFVQGGCGAGAPPAEPETALPPQRRLRLAPWLKTEIPVGPAINKIRSDLRSLKLHTVGNALLSLLTANTFIVDLQVCEEARCPNQSECWGGKEGTATATIMVCSLSSPCLAM